MDKKLQAKLFKKYPLLKPNKKDKTPYGQAGIECRDGWYDLLDLLFARLDFLIRNPDYELSFLTKCKNFYNLTVWNYIFFPCLNKLPYSIYCKLSYLFQFDIRYSKPKINKLEDFSFTQIKEKFGGLRVYTNNSTSHIDGYIEAICSISYRTCESCGSNSQITTNGEGWMKTLCGKCRKNEKVT